LPLHVDDLVSRNQQSFTTKLKHLHINNLLYNLIVNEGGGGTGEVFPYLYKRQNTISFPKLMFYYFFHVF